MALYMTPHHLECQGLLARRGLARQIPADVRAPVESPISISFSGG
jgi:hypothetical protein